MIRTALAELCASLRLEGAAIVDTAAEAPRASLLYSAGTGATAVLELAGFLLATTPDVPSRMPTVTGRHLMVHPWILPPNRAGGLVLWRAQGGQDWTESDTLAAALAGSLLRVMLEHGPDEGGIDRLTGLPNRLYFLEETDRHIERLMQDHTPGTLMFVQLADLVWLVTAHGQAARDWVLVRIGGLIRAMVRPADLVGRVGDDCFAVFLDGVDHMIAAERAEMLCGRRLTLPEAPGRGVIPVPPLAIGIASRDPDGEEDARGLVLRARDAAAVARRTGGGGWHVSRGAR